MKVDITNTIQLILKNKKSTDFQELANIFVHFEDRINIIIMTLQRRLKDDLICPKSTRDSTNPVRLHTLCSPSIKKATMLKGMTDRKQTVAYRYKAISSAWCWQGSVENA